ncbi:MAG: DMT family transporter [Kouleothrix sp.]|jgi:drug/metabolite transporter (DMT)-like permease|nr:DMT family transporter [Kouleothrix sp.]
MTSASLTRHEAARQSHLAVLAMAGINMIWGAAFPLTKPALEHIPPFTFALLRFALALAVLLPLARRAPWRLLRGPDAGRVIAMGLSGFCFVQLSQTIALQLSPAADIAMIATTTPLWVALLAWPWLGERLSWRGGLGFVLAIGGLLLILWPQGAAGSSFANRVIGDAIFVAGSLGWAVYNLLGRDLMRRHAPLPATTAAGVVGTLAMLPFAAYEWANRQLPSFTPIGVAALGYTGLLVTVLGFLVLFWALGRAGAAQVAAMMYFQPLAGVLLAWLFLREPLGGAFLAGAALMLTGVSLVVLWPGGMRRTENQEPSTIEREPPVLGS